MEKIEFLQSYKKSLNREQRISEHILEYRERQASASAIRYTGMPHGTENRDLSDYIVKLEEKIGVLMNARYKTDQISDVIVKALSRLDNQNESAVLYYKYIKFWNNQKIADKIGYERTGIYKVERRALKHLELHEDEIEQIENLLYIP